MKKLIPIMLILLSGIFTSCMKTVNVKEEKTTNFKKVELVELSSLDETLKLDIRYATKNNFLQKPVYNVAKAFLQKPVAEDLIKISKKLNDKGFGIIVFDGYRPWTVTKIFWDETPEEERKFVANPEKGSNHNRGCAIDITLYDLKTGTPLEMPCEYDTFSEEAFPSYKGRSKKAIENRDFLIKELEEDGNFKVYPYEWWHFDHKTCKDYPVLDTPLEEL